MVLVGVGLPVRARHQSVHKRVCRLVDATAMPRLLWMGGAVVNRRVVSRSLSAHNNQLLASSQGSTRQPRMLLLPLQPCLIAFSSATTFACTALAPPLSTPIPSSLKPPPLAPTPFPSTSPICSFQRVLPSYSCKDQLHLPLTLWQYSLSKGDCSPGEQNEALVAVQCEEERELVEQTWSAGKQLVRSAPAPRYAGKLSPDQADPRVT
jgi:hypothetical protein